MMRALFARIAPHLQLDAYLNFVPTESGDALVLGLVRRHPRGAGAEHPERLELGQQRLRRGRASGASRSWRRHVSSRDDPTAPDDARRCGVRAYFCSPLIAEGRLLGTLSFGSRRRDAFDSDELEFLQTISRYVTVACERAHLSSTCATPTAARTSSWRRWRTSCAIRWRRSATRSRSCRCAAGTSPAVEQARGMMERQLGQMVRLIDDLLDVERITRGKLELRKERVDLASVLASAVETAAR